MGSLGRIYKYIINKGFSIYINWVAIWLVYGQAVQKGNNNMKLRDYQIDIIDKLQSEWRKGYKRTLIQLPCGAGKTVVFAEISDRSQKNDKTVWFLVHRQELLKQTLDTFRRFDIPMDNIVIEMVGKVSRKPERYPEPDMIVFDEAHFSRANTWQKIIDMFPDTYICGLTATPCRLDGKPLGMIYETLIEGVTTNELIKSGYLSKYIYYAPVVADLTGLNKKGFDYDMHKATELLSERAVYGDVIKHYRTHADGLQTICYCTSISHSQDMAQAFCGNGIKAVHFDGNTPTAQREKIVKDFRDKKIQVLCNVDLISVGFDCPDCHCCILLRPTMSTALFIQQACRALRPAENKTAIILDCVNNYERFGLPTDNREWSLESKFKQKEQYDEDGMLRLRTCSNCLCTYEGHLKSCPYCDKERELTARELQNIRNAELEEIKQSEEREATQIIKNIRITDCNSLKEMQLWCKVNGKKAGYAWYTAKAKGLVS